MSDTSSFGKAIFYFLAALPYKLFQIAYFVFSFPRRLRYFKEHRSAPKTIVFQRILGKHSVLSAVEAIHALREASGQIAHRPSMFALLEDLWNEGMSEDWKLPMVSELQIIQTRILADLACVPFAERGAVPLIWAIDDFSHMFVLFNPHVGSATDPRPRNMHVVFRGEAPDSHEKHIAYAISVRVVRTG